MRATRVWGQSVIANALRDLGGWVIVAGPAVPPTRGQPAPRLGRVPHPCPFKGHNTRTDGQERTTDQDSGMHA
jgi:hypothetical protein